jgi:hypothetical protein
MLHGKERLPQKFISDDCDRRCVAAKVLFWVFPVALVVNHSCAREDLRRFRSFMNIYGRVPFLFYIAHIFVIHALALGVAVITTPNWCFWITPDAVFTRHFNGWGYTLPVIYFIWMLVVFALYPLCAWFSGLKDRRRSWWLAYL